MTTFATIGRPVTRQEGPDKVSGTFLYSADVNLPGMLWGKVLRSPHPHARIVSIDVSAAEALPGVRAVITGKDTAGMRVGRMVRDVPLLAEDVVRFVGEKVAAVAADDPDTAEEALLLIDVEYEPLPAVFDPVEAMDPSSHLVHEGNPVFETSSGPVQLDEEEITQTTALPRDADKARLCNGRHPGSTGRPREPSPFSYLAVRGESPRARQAACSIRDQFVRPRTRGRRWHPHQGGEQARA